jgi:hypothetical protein
MQKIISLLFLLIFYHDTTGQVPLPVIRANSKGLVIKDGPHIIGGILVPEAKPDTYWAEMPKKPQRISIHTDCDSIVFDTHFETECVPTVRDCGLSR